MVDKKVTGFGILGVLLVSGLGGYLFTFDELDKAYTCNINNVTGIFESFSSTMKTAYWINEEGVSKRSVCRNGYWIKTTEWLKVNGLDKEIISIDDVNESDYTEDNIEIISIGDTIVIDKNRKVDINGQIYNITYIGDKYKIKCICDKISGCKIKDCLQ
jgi:hypothetical protein